MSVVSVVELNDQIRIGKGRNLSCIQKPILAAFNIAPHETVPIPEHALQIAVSTPAEYTHVGGPIESRKLFQCSPTPGIDIES